MNLRLWIPFALFPAALTFANAQAGSAPTGAPGEDPIEQAVSLTKQELFALSSERARLERRALFLDGWQAATIEAQARARRVLGLERDGADRLAGTPGVRALTKAWRSLIDPEHDPATSSPFQDLADSIDLRLVPGLYEGRPNGKPEAMTARVTTLYAVPIGATVNVSLLWLDGNGAELKARSEPIVPRAFSGQGFQMYLRAPSAVPGSWHLVCEIEAEGEAYRGVPVPVIGLDEPELLASENEAEIRTQFRLLREHGVRPTFFRAFLKRLGALPAEEAFDWRGARSNAIRGECFERLKEAGRTCWSVGADEVDSPKCIVLLLRPEDERAEAVLVGAVGDAWAAAAAQHSWWVLSTDLRLVGDGELNLLQLAAQLRKLKPDAKLVLVGRGSGLLEIQLAQLHDLDWELDGLALSTVLSASGRPRNLPNVPGLFISSESESRGKELLADPDRARWTWEKRTAPLVVTDLELPSLVAAWLAQE